MSGSMTWLLRIIAIISLLAFVVTIHLRVFQEDAAAVDNAVSTEDRLRNGSQIISDEAEKIDTRRHYIRTDSEGTAWVESHVPRNQTTINNTLSTTNSNRDIRISFRLHDPNDVPYPTKFLSVDGYMCPSFGAGPLPQSMSGRTVLNFTTTISTDLNILFIGDSISQQFAQGFYASVLGEDNVGSHVIKRSFINGQDILTSNSGLHVCSSVVAPIRGGGTAAYWRVLELMSNKTKAGAYVNCKREKTWLEQDVKKLMQYHRFFYPMNGTNANVLVKKKTNKNNGATTWYEHKQSRSDITPQEQYNVGSYDAAVLRPQHGWMNIDEITRERIVEEIVLCNQVTGASTVIISTLPLNNNVITPSDWEGIIAINQMIRDIAHTWKSSGVRHVLVQEFGNLTNQMLWLNAQHIGYNVTIPDFTKNDGWEKQGSDFLLHRYHGVNFDRFQPAIAMVCAFKWIRIDPDQDQVDIDSNEDDSGECTTPGWWPDDEHRDGCSNGVNYPKEWLNPKQLDFTFFPTFDQCCETFFKGKACVKYDSGCIIEKHVIHATGVEQPDQCFNNKISRDGMHWCVETIGGRYSASIACLLGCVYNGGDEKGIHDIRKCEQACNDQFMSLFPVAERWIGSDTTLFARS